MLIGVVVIRPTTILLINNFKNIYKMSNGKMCGCKIKISTEINGTNNIEVECDNYEGHDGNHSKMFYHCVDRPNDKIFKDNHRLGRIEWKPELVEKQEKEAQIERWAKNGAFIDKPRSTI